MQKWEYLTVRLDALGVIIGTQVAPRSMNGKELKGWRNVSVEGLVSQLGDEGWEMTGTISFERTAGHYLFFKRPKL